MQLVWLFFVLVFLPLAGLLFPDFFVIAWFSRLSKSSLLIFIEKWFVVKILKYTKTSKLMFPKDKDFYLRLKQKKNGAKFPTHFLIVSTESNQ